MSSKITFMKLNPSNLAQSEADEGEEPVDEGTEKFASTFIEMKKSWPSLRVMGG